MYGCRREEGVEVDGRSVKKLEVAHERDSNDEHGQVCGPSCVSGQSYSSTMPYFIFLWSSYLWGCGALH
jgi:hypothetical protein